MVQMKVRVRRWGNSMGVIIPKEIIASEKMKEGDEIELALLRDSTGLFNSLWGSGKGTKKSAQQIKDGLRRELYDD